MGDSPPPNVPATQPVGDIMQAIIDHLPDYVKTVTGVAPSYEQAQADLQKTIQPQIAQSNADLYKNIGPQLAQTGSDIARQNALNQASTENAVLQGPGTQEVQTAQRLQQQVDPEFYSTRALAGSKFSDLLSSYDPNGISGGDMAQVERGLNRQNAALGTGDTPTSTGNISNAFAYGDKLQQNKSNLGAALSQVPAFLNASKSGTDVLQQAVGRSSSANPGQGQFMGYQQPNVGSATNNMAAGMMNSATSMQQAGLAFDANTYTNQSQQISQLMPSIIPCCFIFMQAYNGTLPWFIRHNRDMHYKYDINRGKGYKWMAKWLVPLIEKSEFVSNLVNEVMIIPLSKYGGWLTFEEGYNHEDKSYRSYFDFWMNLWSFIGRRIGKESK